MAATLDGMYEETYIVSPINLELFLRWAMAAEEADIDRAMQTVYLIDHRMDGDDVARRAMRATLRGRGELVPGVLNKAHAALSPSLGALGREIAAFFFCPESPWHARRRRRSPEWSQAQGG